MSSKEVLLGACKRISWLEKAMKDDYSKYKKYIKDKDIVKTISEIERDEIRHINIIERVIALLQN